MTPIPPQTPAGKLGPEYLPDRGKSPCGFDHVDLREQAATEARRELLAKVEGLHHPTTQDDYVAIPMVTNTVCAHCYIGVDDVHELWPCPTMALLDPSR